MSLRKIHTYQLGRLVVMMSSLPEGRSIGFMPPGNEMSEVGSRCLPHRQLWVSNLSKVATQWLEVDSNLRPSGCKAQNIPLHHRVPLALLYPHKILRIDIYP